MNQIARLLSPTNVLVNLSVTSKKRLFEQAGLLFENNFGIERGKVFDSLFARERLGSTGLGHGYSRANCGEFPASTSRIPAATIGPSAANRPVDWSQTVR